MSEVKDVRNAAGGVSEPTSHTPGDPAPEALSGYLCGVCEEPLPYGATACVACGTPVAPLDDDEMVAGPYVLGAAGGDAAAADPARAPGAPGDPADLGAYGTAGTAGWSAASMAAYGEGAGDPAAADVAGADTRPPPPVTTPYEGANGAVPSGNGHDLGPGAAVADRRDAPPTVADTPRDLDLGRAEPGPAEPPAMEQAPPTYPRPPAPDPGRDPMQGWAPAATVAPPPLPDEDAPLLQGLQAAERRIDRQAPAGAGSSKGPLLLVVAAVVLLAVVAAGAFAVIRGGQAGDTATSPSTTGAALPAPPPSVRNSTPASTATPSPEPAVTPNLDTFCAAAGQFRLDPDPDSVAAKFLANPAQLVTTVDLLVMHAPEDARASMTPLRESVRALAGKVSAGELRTVADVRNAQGPTGTPLWPRYDPVVTAYNRFCVR